MNTTNKIIVWAVLGGSVFAVLMVLMLYSGEIEKNTVLRSEHLKTAEDAQTEVKKLKEDFESEGKKNLQEKQMLLAQVTQAMADKDKAIKEMGDLKKNVLKEHELSLVANEDLDTLRSEVAQLSKESQKGIKSLEENFKKKKQIYDTRILSLEAQLEKAKSRLTTEAERYHYNLGVFYTQNKNFDLAVTEFKTALTYNPRNAQAHYNLGIIFDDYFKDKENARYHYKSFLELEPSSDDADSVREWLAAIK